MDVTDPIAQVPAFKDRKAGLVLFGVLHIGLGGLCALMVPLMIVGMVASKTFNSNTPPPMDMRMLAPSLIFYVAIATWFIWMGIGSILARRWARALLLVSSWIWLLCGIGGLLMVWLILPDMYAQMGSSGQMPTRLATDFLYITLAFMTVFYVFIPATLVLFYGSKHVRATCEFRNPRPSWTDACPLPVLALSLLFTFWACSMGFMGFYGWVFPFFGFLLSGPAGAAVALATAVALAYIAWGTYRLDVRAWSCAGGLIVCWTLSASITFSRFSLMDLYAKMKFPEQQLELMKPVWNSHGQLFALFFAVWIAGLLGYLAYTRKFCLSNRAPSTSNAANGP